MKKDFDDWNKIKKTVEQDISRKFYRAREIWWCALGVNVGFEQDGKGFRKERPVLILRDFNEHVCLVLPLTTSKKHNRFYYLIGIVAGKQASVIISQIRLVDTKRLTNKIDVLEQTLFENIRKAVKDLL